MTRRFARILIPSLLVFMLGSVALAQTPQPSPPRKTIALPGGHAKASPEGPVKPTWESLKENYQTPDWFRDAKFGIFIHYGPYTVAAYASEWYPRHMYSNPGVIKWHAERFGPQDRFGYKDMIPLFKTEKFNPDDWAKLFEEAGAKYVIITAEHHDGFAMYDSALTKWNAKKMGPKRDIVGDMAKSSRAHGLKFGVSNHRMEHWDFMYPLAGLKTDLFNPKYADFYGPPQPPPGKGQKIVGEVMEEAAGVQSQAFLEEWLARNEEIVDKYQPDIYFFDNGINPRRLDEIKLRFAAYYYNSALKWGKQVSLNTKADAYLAATITDYERHHRTPKSVTPAPWQTDDPIGDKFGYVEGMSLMSADTIIKRLVTDVARNGNYALNISPKANGTIPDDQQKVLREVGAWLKVNGEAIYGTRPYSTDTDGAAFYTRKGSVLYATVLNWPTTPLVLSVIPTRISKVSKVTLLGYDQPLSFTQDEQGVSITFPDKPFGASAYALKIEGSKLP